jgi:hypothetical protein
VPAAQPPSPNYTVVHFDSLSAALDSSLTEAVRVVAFGEIHKTENSSLVSTLQHFAPEAFPLLAQRHFNDFVFEGLPSSRQAAIEASRGRFGHFLQTWFAYHADYCGILSVLRQASQTGVRLHGVNFQNLAEQYAHFPQAAELINQRTLTTTQELLARGRRVALYNGLDHNNLTCLYGNTQTCFGQTLRRQLGSGYIEVDLLIPELAQLVSAGNIAFPEWISNIPSQGVNRITFENGRTIIIFPWSITPIQEEFPIAAPACI